MSIETRLGRVTQRASNLLGGAQVHLLLTCSDPSLRHPLLATLPQHLRAPLTHDVLPYLTPVLSGKEATALCDIAMQRREIWTIDEVRLADRILSMAAAPLTLAEGILGVLLFIKPLPAAFQYGEYQLLEQFVPYCAAEVAQIVQEEDTGLCRYKDANTSCNEQQELISLVCHELRKPLTAMKGYIGLLRTYSAAGASIHDRSTAIITAARQRQYLTIIEQQIGQLEVLTSDLLDTSFLQNGQLTFHCKWVDIAQLCKYVRHLMLDRIAQQYCERYDIRCNMCEQQPLAWADPHRVQQVLTNLLENAIKYSPEGGTIEILVSTTATDTSLPRDSLAVTIRDQGIGIPQQQQYALFTPFSRIERPATKSIPGRGLGLYISRKLIEAMGGYVVLHSKEGQGTSITFTLPTRA